MKKLEESNFTAIIKTPVFLDATCSGIQHLSAMMKDLELAKKVNLTKSNKTDTPYDLYSEIIEPVNILLNNFGKENIEHAALSLVKFTRKEIKPIVMTKVYNISVYGIAQQLSSSFKRETLIKEINSLHEKIVNGIKDGLKKKQQSKFEVEYYAPGIDGEVILTRKNIYKIAELINDKIFLLFPSLNYIYTYLKNISKFMIKLNLPLTWITPSGIKINQNYLKTKTKKLPINLFGSKKTLVIKESLNVTDNYKQINAIIPNIIHSLDAAHLMNLINTSKEKGIGPVITVHDCFGTLPNNMEKLQLEVKKEFILLYTQHAFLETFHNRVIQTIRDNNIEVIEIDGLAKYVLFFNETIEIPQLPISGKLDLEDVKHSTYMIS